MNAQEAALLCRYVKACCPQQAIDEYTPTAWADLLSDVRLEDAKEAVRRVVARQPFIAPAEIRAEVRRIRTKRIDDHPPLTPPAGLTDAEERRWLREARWRIGNGEAVVDTSRVLVAGSIRELLAAAEPRDIDDDTEETTDDEQ